MPAHRALKAAPAVLWVVVGLGVQQVAFLRPHPLGKPTRMPVVLVAVEEEEVVVAVVARTVPVET